jgi:hypothetical protein
VSLGPLVAPAGSTLLLSATYTAAFNAGMGLWRSSSFTPRSGSSGGGGGRGTGSEAAATDGTSSEVVMLTTQFETTFARTVLPCMDLPAHKVRRALALALLRLEGSTRDGASLDCR